MRTLREFYDVCDKNIFKHLQPKEIMTEIAENTNYTWEQFEEVGYDYSAPSSSKKLLCIPRKSHFSLFFSGIQKW